MKYKYKYKKRKKKLKLKNKNYIFYIIFTLIRIIIISFLFKFILFGYNSSEKTIKNIIYNKTEIIDEYLATIPSKYKSKKNEEKQNLEKYTSFKDLTKKINKKELTEIKANFRNYFISFLNKKNVSDVKLFF